MITSEQIHEIASKHLQGTSLFIVDILVKPGNKIMVFVDGEQRVSIEACIQLSRQIESELNRETEDFDLTVSTCGADRPLKMPRQYRKNIGFMLDIETVAGDKITGTLLKADDDCIEIQKKPEKKAAKNQEQTLLTIRYSDIKSAKEVITFKK